MPDPQTPSFKFQLSSSSSFRDNRGSQIYSRGPCTPWTPPSGKMLTDPSPEVLAYIYITVKFQIRSSINMRLAESSVYNRLCIERSPKMGFWGDFGVGWRYLVGKYIRPHNYAFSDIFGPDLTRRVVAICMDIAICHRRKFGQVWGSPAPSTRSRRKTPRPEGTPLDLPLPHGKIVIILRCNPWAAGWSSEGTF